MTRIQGARSYRRAVYTEEEEEDIQRRVTGWWLLSTPSMPMAAVVAW
jgi:hypothetical protein